MSEMDYAQASSKLADLIKQNDDYAEMNGLRIQVYCDAVNDGDTPAMALALAKNLDCEAGYA